MNNQLNRRNFLTNVAKGAGLLALDFPFVAIGAGQAALPITSLRTFNLNQNWDFFRPDEAAANTIAASLRDQPMPADVHWERVNVPHSVRLEPFNASGGINYQGLCWYRKTLIGRPSWAGKTIYLHVEGAMQVAEVWVNGAKLFTHYGGYLPFTVDLTGKLLLDGRPNTLILKLDNSDNPEVPPGKPQNKLDFCYFGGLYRSVRLEVLEPVHVSDTYLANRVAGGGIFVTYPEVSAALATVAVQTEIQNDDRAPRHCLVTQEIIGANDDVVATATQELDVPAGKSCVTKQSLVVRNPLLWHPHHPNLHVLRTTVSDGKQTFDQRTTRIGIRRFQFTREGLFINGEKFFSLGANRHQDHPYVGYALPPSAHYRDARKLREAGFTSFRSHYPQDPSFMDACDELGILAIVSNPGWQFYGDPLFVERSYQNCREMVRRDRNHPCVVLWEPILNETHYPEEFCRTVHNIVHAEYPGDQCYTAGDGQLGNGENILDVLYKSPTDNSKPHWIREWGDGVDNWSDQQARVRVDRAWGEMPMLVQTRTHLAKLEEALKSNGGSIATTTLGGADLWAGIDCYRGYHHQPFYGGPLDLFRLPKLDYYFFQSQRPPEVILPVAASGPMVFIANYSTPYSPKAVTVFSNCKEVRLYQDGKLLATQKPDAGQLVAHPPFTFETSKSGTEMSTYYMTNVETGAYRPAEFKAEGLIGGQVVAEHVVKAPGVMSQIKLVVDDGGRELTADGADWIRVHALVCDRRGVVNPFSEDWITFDVEGPGEIINDARIRANPVQPRFGIATALVRAGLKPGLIRVRATAFGLAAAETLIESKPAEGMTL